MKPTVCGIYPQYAQIICGGYVLSVRVSFHIPKDLVVYLKDNKNIQVVQDRKGQNYVAKQFCLSYSDCRMGIQEKVWEIAPQMKDFLKKAIRVAKIAKLKDEIDAINATTLFQR